MKKIGIFGGSFNPVHIAHLIIAECFSEQCGLDKVIFVPAYISPFKERNDCAVDDRHRVEMLKLAIKNNSGFDIDLFEINRKNTSYTIDTLNHIKTNYAGSEIFLLIGGDQAALFNKWKDWKEILLRSKLCVAGRNVSSGFENDEVSSFIRRNQIEIFSLNSPLLEISSESIRSKIKAGESIKYLVPAEVGEYIKHNLLYSIA